ncbi:ABC transporter ATP-binding protein [Bariatricus sp. SGI.154]|uniref:ABC transporter ATP-binding protein n=1 Tax=Bariatricus sp. SGI.154 TaxID=3420549 RepID=UPI003D08A904
MSGNETIISIDHVSKEYRLGAIGGGTLRGDLQSWWAKKRGKEDPNVKLDNVGKAVDGNTKFLALDNVSFEVKKGEALGIIGHNGAGKSTLLKLLSRVTAPSVGTISYNGRIASMLEVGTGFHPELTGRENVYMNGAILGMTKAEISRKFDEIVSFAEMEKFIDTPVKRYSSGMYVKLAFAVAAHLDSEIMVMDEVLAVGDMKFQQKCLGKMGDAANNEGRTVLYVSHNMNTIRQLCTRCVVLGHGKLIYDGDVDTAISIYSDAQKKMEYHYDYRNIPRSVAKSRTLEFLEMDILNDPSAPIKVGDEIRLKLRCKANGMCNNMKLRFEIVASDNTIAGTMFTDKTVRISMGKEKEIELLIDTSHMTPGNYRFDMLAFEQNDFGVQDFVDKVEGAAQIELVRKNETDLEWLPQFWGHTRFKDIIISDL